MNIQIICPWCEDEITVNGVEAEEDVLCGSCSSRFSFAPDPTTTYTLLYDAA